MVQDRVGIMSARMRWIRLAWLAMDLALLGPFMCFFNRNTLGLESGLVLSDLFFVPWVSVWVYFIFWRRFSDVLAKTLVLLAGLVWSYECHEGIWRFVEGGAWDQVMGFMTHEFINGLGFCFAWSTINWLLGRAVLWAYLRVKRQC